MIERRSWHTTTPLPTGGLLIAGGHTEDQDAASRRSTEIWDPAVRWFRPSQPLLADRFAHVAVARLDGSTLFVGGAGQGELRAPNGTSAPVGTPGGSSHLFAPAGSLLPNGSVVVTGGRWHADDGEPTPATLLFQQGDFTNFAPMGQGRSDHTTTVLPNGRLLVTGGSLGTEAYAPSDTAEVLDLLAPEGGWTPLPKMTRPRSQHSATLLADGESVLVAGGDPSLELYDVASQTFMLHPEPLPEGDSFHASTLLADGRVLLTGGRNNFGVSAGAVLFDPASHAIAYDRDHARSDHASAVLPTGQLLLIGGRTGQSPAASPTADLFDPIKRTYTSAGSLAEPLLGLTATLIDGGRVLVTGGKQGTDAFFPVSSAVQIWQPSDKQGSFSTAGDLHQARAFHTATRLRSGAVLVVGGRGASHALGSAEVLDGATGAARATAGLGHPRHHHAAALLPSGRVLVAGGLDGDDQPVPVPELYDPASETWSAVTSGSITLSSPAVAAILPTGEALVAGDLLAYRFDEATGAIAVAGVAPIKPFGAAVLPGGRVVVCGLDRCDVAAGAGGTTRTILDGAQRDGHGFAALSTGEVFAQGFTPIFSRHTFAYRGFPHDAPRPAIDDVTPAKLTAGALATITGSRFTSLSAVGASNLPPRPEVLPRVVFVPAASGPPVGAELRAWADGAITFVAPRTAYPGGGFLHVIVESVPSVGRWVEIAPSPLGAPCAQDGECGSGHCAEGVCCDGGCSDGCRSCRGNLTGGEDGACAPIPADGAPRFGCEATESVCGPSGTCDGAGACAYPAGTACDEVPGGRCAKGVCVGGCVENLDCPDGKVCYPDGLCGPPVDPGPDDTGCACRSGGARTGTGAGALVAALLLALGRRLRTASRPRGWARGRRTDGTRALPPRGR